MIGSWETGSEDTGSCNISLLFFLSVYRTNIRGDMAFNMILYQPVSWFLPRVFE